jgi:hypothetical protein
VDRQGLPQTSPADLTARVAKKRESDGRNAAISRDDGAFLGST